MLALLFATVLAAERPLCLEYSPDGRAVATGCAEGVVLLLNLDGKETGRLEGHLGPVWHTAYSPDGGTLYAGSAKEVSDEESLQIELAGGKPYWVEVIAWDVAAGKERWRYQEARVNYPVLAALPDGKFLAVSSGLNGEAVRLLATDTGKEVFTYPAGRGTVRRLAFSPDGVTLAAGTDYGVCLLDVPGRRQRALFAEVADQVAFSGDGRLLVTKRRQQFGERGDPPLCVCDAATGRVLREIAAGGKIVSVPKTNVVALVGDGFSFWDVVTVIGDGISFWDMETGKRVARLTVPAPRVWAARFSPDGRRVAGLAGGFDEAGFKGTVKVWDTPPLP